MSSMSETALGKTYVYIVENADAIRQLPIRLNMSETIIYKYPFALTCRSNHH